jgi:hypothetical protein
MICLWRQSPWLGLCLISIGWLASDPAPAAAAWFGVRNDSNMVIIFQGASVDNNVVRRGKAHVLSPGQETWELITPGVKIVTVYDGRVPGRVLYERTFPVGPNDNLLFYSIQVGIVQVAPGVLVPQAQLFPGKPRTLPRQR